jgi:hypothetical protein
VNFFGHGFIRVCRFDGRVAEDHVSLWSEHIIMSGFFNGVFPLFAVEGPKNWKDGVSLL